MKDHQLLNGGERRFSPLLSRRRFVQGVAAGGIAACFGMTPERLFGGTAPAPAIPTLTGTDFDLEIGPAPVRFSGSPAIATAINGSVPAPILRWRKGDRVRLRVTNRLPVSTSIHWHGIILPFRMDGVPGISFDGIAPGETFEYAFQVNQTGTYWYHSHSEFQEQTGMYGAIVVDPPGPDPYGADRDYVLVLSDWTDEDPQRVYAKLKKLSHYYNRNERTLGDLLRDIEERGVEGTWRDRQMWNDMRMSDRDLSDVTGYTYTFLMNGQPAPKGWMGLFGRGEKVRLRIINASAMTFFDFRIPELAMTVIAADGQDVEPVTVDEFRIGVAETLDVLVEPKADRAYTLFAQAIDRSGYARGTLTPHPSLEAPVPSMDRLPILTHGDMGMGHGAHAGHDMASMDNERHSGHDMGSMDHSRHTEHDMASMDHSRHAGHDMGSMSQSEHAGHQMQAAASMGSGGAGYGSARPLVHAETEYGPHVDMRADAAQYRLDDPGVGLRNNGRRVLTYADLRNRAKTPDPREPGREIELHLTGNMSRYMWSMNGIKFADAEPLRLQYGERVRITLVNDTMMNHPIHLHGMWSDLETGDGNHIPRKHTVVAQPGAKISYLITADAAGGWAYHCHLLYHMPGMFREVVVS